MISERCSGAGPRWLEAAATAVTLVVSAAWVASAAPAEYSWQKPHAVVGETGDLEWAPEPFVFEAGPSVRYIDFDGGNDAADGTSKESAWKHHPWDPSATGRAAAESGVHTYVFKGGVAYRGELDADESGTESEPIRLTRDPSWGEGDAVLCGSEIVTGWTKGATHPDIPDPDTVWYADLDWLPRNVWMVDDDGAITRIPLARTPNWTVSNPDDIKSEWWTWKNPQNPFDNYATINGSRRHLAFDADHINESRPQDYYEGAIVWSSKGWVMGSPFPAHVLQVDREQGSLAFPGQWGGGPSYKIIRGCRYYLEDKPHYLDSPGEFWFDRRGNGGRLYIRLPGDRDPNTARVEAAKRIHVVESTGMSHVHITGLTFRFTNVYWDLTVAPWWVSHVTKDSEPACVRLLGSGDDIRISNCQFEHVHGGVRLKAEGDHDAIDRVVISDNVFDHNDRGAIEVSEGSHWGVAGPPIGKLYDVRVLRNKLEHIGMRPDLFGQGQALDVIYAQTLEVAGNVLNRVYSAGIDVQGGKASGALTDRPFCRLLIHHNKVVDPLLNNDDFGGIETWQGGPAYVYNNISGNPGGYRNWDNVLSPDTEDRFGHAYYLDGAFKNYHFNNIAWGKSKGPSGPLANTSAFQQIISYQNTFFNNTIYNFVRGSRRQAPQAGRDKYLGNIWQDMGYRVFRDADPARTAAAGNEADAGRRRAQFAIETDAYANNVFYDVGEHFGVLEPTGRWLDSLDAFRAVLTQYGALADQVGTMADTAPLRDAGNHDFRLAPGSAARDHGVKAFVPWSLYEVVGEWNFYPMKSDPTRVMDEHWCMTPYYVRRDNYYERPMYPLHAVNVGAADYTAGPLEDWTTGALSLNGRDQYAVLPNAKLDEPYGQEVTYRVPDWGTMTVPTAITPGQRCQISVKLDGVDEPMKVKADLHWGKEGGAFGGFNAWGGDAQDVKGEGPYVFTFMPQDKPDLTRYIVTVYLTPTGEWVDRTVMAQTEVPRGDAAGETREATLAGGEVTETRGVSGPDLKNPEVYSSNFLLEACFRTEPDAGPAVLIEKMSGTGYSLAVSRVGTATFAIAGAAISRSVNGQAQINDGQWHHVIAEADRAARTITLYVDGKVDATGQGIGPDVSLANDGDLYVGGTPDGRCLAGAIDFMRVALGTLADAKTTIEELYAWEFDGPFLRDFCGNEPVGKRDAGAIEALQ